MKRIFAIALTICVLTSALCFTTFAAEAPASSISIQLSADKSDASNAVAFLNEDYIMLAIAIIGLVATIVSVILLTADRRKEAAENRKKESDENRKKKY